MKIYDWSLSPTSKIVSVLQEIYQNLKKIPFLKDLR